MNVINPNYIYQNYNSDLRYINSALDPKYVKPLFDKHFKKFNNIEGSMTIENIKLLRHKPDRRFLNAYEISYIGKNGNMERIKLIGKSRIKGLDYKTYSFVKLLWESEFGESSKDNVYVPEPIATIPELNMWLQKYIDGDLLTDLIFEDPKKVNYKNIITAIYKLHNCPYRTSRVHSLSKELVILQDLLERVVKLKPCWYEKIEYVLSECYKISASINQYIPYLIHRDFYSDQVILSGDNIYIIDLDLHSMGDPSLDIGNFLGHISECSLRKYGDHKYLFNIEEEILEHYRSVYNVADIYPVQVYRILTLARHIYISSVINERREFTEEIFKICKHEISEILKDNSRKMFVVN